MASQTLELIFGGGGIGFIDANSEFGDPAGAFKALDVLKKNNIIHIDSARSYGKSEAILGEVKAGTSGFTLDTKWAPSLFPGFEPLKKDVIVAAAKDSISKLKVNQVDVFYMHGPELNVSFEEQLEGVNEVYKLGLFKRFGVSNFTAQQVQEVYEIAEKKGYVKPSVYQGLYTPVNRKVETTLFPVLRKLGIAFRAYSPVAGGFLTKTKAGVQAGEGRMGMQGLGPMYVELYNKPEYLNALEQWGKIADEEGVTKAELALRWVSHHGALKANAGDGIIFGAGTVARVQQTVDYLEKGPLSAKAVEGIEKVWKSVEPISYENNIVAAQKLMSASTEFGDSFKGALDKLSEKK